jgi:hypothetical protein
VSNEHTVSKHTESHNHHDMANILLNGLLLFVLGSGGFCLGAIVIGRIYFLRRHPRYLMAIGAGAMPAVWAGHAIVGTHPALVGLDLIVLMTGVGMIAAGWDGETEMEYERDTERVKRLRAAWELRNTAAETGSRSSHRDENSDEASEPAAATDEAQSAILSDITRPSTE